MKVTVALEIRTRIDDMVEALSRIKKIDKLEDLRRREIYLDSEGNPLLYLGRDWLGDKGEYEFIERMRETDTRELTNDYYFYSATDKELSFTDGKIKLPIIIPQDIRDKERSRKTRIIHGPYTVNGDYHFPDPDWDDIDMIASEVEF